jgi:EAL domain-containing protein (putative c-di-GMP-specific phosphodiesterase class I)
VAKNPENSDSAPGREDLTDDLSSALEADQFFLMYQPTMDLQTDAFAGVEALIRWRYPGHGVINPETFISKLENSGQIVPVGRWALVTACAQGALWHAKGYRFAVSVNISSKQLESAQFTDDVAEALSSSRFDPALLVLEFAQETLTRDAESTLERLEPLKNLGVRLAVDDFDPDGSPLAELDRFHIDIVKLDKDFISRISSSPDASKIHDLVQLSRKLKIQIFASGIENAEQVKQLQIEEVNIGQGFFFSRPHEAAKIDQFLEDFAIFSGKPL